MMVFPETTANSVRDLKLLLSDMDVYPLQNHWAPVMTVAASDPD